MPHFDPTSATVVLRYVGDGRPVDGAKLADLTENDLCRMAHGRALGAVAQDIGQPIDPEDPDAGVYTRPDPRTPDQRAVAALVDELVATGHFEPVSARNAGQAAKAAKAEHTTESPTEAPATPASGKEA